MNKHLINENCHIWFSIGENRYVVDFKDVELNLDLNGLKQSALMRSKIRVIINRVSAVYGEKVYRSFEDMKVCGSTQEVMNFINDWKRTASG